MVPIHDSGTIYDTYAFAYDTRPSPIRILAKMSMPKQAIGERHEQLKAAAKEHIDTNLLKAKFDTSHFDINAILRGMQLTLVGGNYE
jgi:hypothetical protein